MAKTQWTVALKGYLGSLVIQCIQENEWHDSASHDQPKALCAAERAGGHWRRAVGDSLAQPGLALDRSSTEHPSRPMERRTKKWPDVSATSLACVAF